MHEIDCARDLVYLADEILIGLPAVIFTPVFVHAKPLCLANQGHYLDCSRN